MDTRKFVIVGAGQCGAWIARTLRQGGADGPVTLVGAERHSPYERPPLSKEALHGPLAVGHGELLTSAEASELGLALRLETAVTRIDRARRQIDHGGGAAIDYDVLFLAMGSRPRGLPGATPGPKVAYLRTREDADQIRGALATCKRLIVIGGGWIGLEVAAAAATQGVVVTVLEQALTLCARLLPERAALELQKLHEAHGVTVRLGVAIVAIDVADQAVRVELADGSTEAGDFLVVGVGGVANDELARACGLRTDGGIVVDRYGRTSDPSIFAAGDVARIQDEALGLLPRFESWANAQDQGIATAKAALGGTQPYDAVPWFWSQQYDSVLQMAGLYAKDQAIHHRSGAGKAGWLQVGVREGGVNFVCAMRAPREFRVARSWIGTSAQLNIPVFEDPSTELAAALLH